MHHIFTVYELLEQVIAELERKSLPVAARVCKRWSECSLDRIWASLSPSQSTHLFRVLGPVNENSETLRCEYIQTKPFPSLDDSACTRFIDYARRIRSLAIDPEDHGQLLEVIVESGLPFNKTLFPNLRSLDWSRGRTPHSLLEYSPLLMNPVITSFTISSIMLNRSWSGGCNMDESALDKFFTTLIDRMPFLTTFVFAGHWTKDLTPHLRRIFTELKALQTVKIGSDCDVLALVAEEAFKLPKLKEMEFNEFFAGCREPVYVPTIAGELPALESLVVRLTFGGLMRLASQPNWPSATLRRLNLASLMIEPLPVVQELCSTISQACPQLEELHVWSSHPYGLLMTTGIDPGDIAFEDIRPLLSCKKLRELVWQHPSPIFYTSTSFDEMVQAWPNLERLFLEDDAGHSDIPENALPTYRSLLTLTKLTSLRQLRGLRISSSSWEEPNNKPGQAFESLVELDIHESALEDRMIPLVASRLSQICPRECSIREDSRGLEDRLRWRKLKELMGRQLDYWYALGRGFDR